MYWVELVQGDIRRANLDGTGQQILVSGQNGPLQLALDLAGGQIYWSDWLGGDIRRANLDGSAPEILLSGLYRPSSIALDVAGGKMYWIGDSGFDILRANLGGSEQEMLIRDLPVAQGLRLDLAGGKIYWSDASSDNSVGDIRRANLDGSGQEILIDVPGTSPGGIVLDLTRSQLYWTAGNTGEILRANLDGSEPQILVRGLPGPAGIALAISAPVPVVVTGYSADGISDKDASARFAQPFNVGTYAWFEAGAVDDQGGQHNDGLPAGQTFTSATRSGATYQIQAANASSVLQLSAGQTGTLTLTTPVPYSTLYVLASSGDGTPSSVGSANINFADGTRQAFRYNVFDWCNGPGGPHPEAVLTGTHGRADVGPSGTAFTYNQDCDFQVYETVIAIDPSHAGVAIASIDFAAAPDAVYSNVFGVSGK
jgi:hypothetical protein